ncbi:alpha/beta fold hydrolase [Streptomyces sp. PG2]
MRRWPAWWRTRPRTATSSTNSRPAGWSRPCGPGPRRPSGPCSPSPRPADRPRSTPAGVRTPVLALHGERDRVSPVEVSERLAEALPNGRLRVVAGAGHWIHVDRPDEFCELVGEFLSA